ncbi:hypothetical protein FLM48_15295 [Shewanella sp. Scap07]|uniref:hypothetical protein n=1 Tax=Shewanella sp. Scap07 TaxID=2589987 RepID=UPI0015C04E0E|nr:hypothetical protein [Shewanella sp. Scap07]QLE86317.1 hypothetical protein FLM48_15295 [Shewanella sp. Scap07]
MEPDYHTYTLAELYEVKQHMDQQLYPARYQRVLHEITLRKNQLTDQPVVMIEEKLRSRKDLYAFFKLLYLVLLGYIIWLLYQGLSTGIIYFRADTQFNLQTHPKLYYFTMAFWAVAGFVFLRSLLNRDDHKQGLETDDKT